MDMSCLWIYITVICFVYEDIRTSGWSGWQFCAGAGRDLCLTLVTVGEVDSPATFVLNEFVIY